MILRETWPTSAEMGQFGYAIPCGALRHPMRDARPFRAPRQDRYAIPCDCSFGSLRCSKFERAARPAGRDDPHDRRQGLDKILVGDFLRIPSPADLDWGITLE